MSYTADNIKVLGDIEHILRRSGMYIGEGGDPRSLISEIFDNAIDEVLGGYSPEVVIAVDTVNNVYTVRDFGRGIPHGKKTLENGLKKEVLEVLITKSNSGGKFDNDAYKYSSGLHGVGLTVTNALSEFLHIISYRKNKFVEVYSEQGLNLKITKGSSQEPDGTYVEFKPDKKFFESNIIPIDFIEDRCKVASALGFKARLIIDGSEKIISSDIFSLIQEEDKKISIYHNSEIFDIENSTKERMKVALQYTSATNDRYFGYTNMLTNYMGGTHVQLLSKTISETWETFIEKHKNLRPATDLKKSDYLVGLRAVCAVFISNPEFSSQTKEKLVVKKTYFDEIMGLFSKQLVKYLENNITIALQLVKRFEEYRVALNNLLNRKEISSLIKVSTDDSDNIRRRSIVSKLIDCTSRKRDNTSIFICEGLSAAATFKLVRNREIQAVLPLKGKILNVTGKSIKECVQSAVICDIANSIGCGIGSACDASKSRYEKIIINADADVDGSNITSLLLSFFVNLFPDLVRAGMVYIATPPLYIWGTSVKDYLGCMDIKDVPANAKNLHRIKGLGEFNQDLFEYFIVNPNTAKLLQVDYPSDVEEFNRIMGTSVGKNDALKSLGILEGEMIVE